MTLPPSDFEQTHLVLLRTINASATTLDPALLHRLPGSLPGPWGVRWHQAALAAVVITAHKLNLPAGRAPGLPDPLKTDAPFHAQLPLLMEAYTEYGEAGVRHLLAPVDSYRAQALTLAVFLLLPGPTVSRLLWSVCALLTFVLGNLIHHVRKGASS